MPIINKYKTVTFTPEECKILEDAWDILYTVNAGSRCILRYDDGDGSCHYLTMKEIDDAERLISKLYLPPNRTWEILFARPLDDDDD